MNTRQLQHEMQKVYNIGYDTARRSRELDAATRFVMNIETFDQLMSVLLYEFPDWNNNRQRYISYAITRWYKYQSAKFSEKEFSKYKNVVMATEEEDRFQHIDFYVDGVPFDLKNTMLPKDWKKPLNYTRRNKRELLKWFMDNQSDRSVSNYHNQLFIIFSSSYRPNWMMKAELFLIQRAIKKWMRSYKLDKMNIQLTNRKRMKADAIFVIE